MTQFKASGHMNITAKHKNTIEFTKDKEISPRGDCILAVDADFNLDELKKFIKDKEKLKCVISVEGISDEFYFYVNHDFNDAREIVFRLGEFKSDRTLGIRSSKAAKHIKRELVEKLKLGKRADIKII